jgi:hypothetical protein
MHDQAIIKSIFFVGVVGMGSSNAGEIRKRPSKYSL